MRTVMIYSVLTMLLIGCSDPASMGTKNEPTIPDDVDCIVEQLADGTYVSCDDTDEFIPTDSDDSVPNDSDETSDDHVYCKRGKGHKKHRHEQHEHCD